MCLRHWLSWTSRPLACAGSFVPPRLLARLRAHCAEARDKVVDGGERARILCIVRMEKPLRAFDRVVSPVHQARKLGAVAFSVVRDVPAKLGGHRIAVDEGAVGAHEMQQQPILEAGQAQGEVDRPAVAGVCGGAP